MFRLSGLNNFFFGCTALFFWSPLLSAQSGNLITNGAFSLPLAPAWQVSSGSDSLGAASIAGTSKTAALRLSPNTGNGLEVRTEKVFGMGQGVRVSGMAGKTLYVQGAMRTEGSARAMIQLVALSSTGSARFVALRQESPTSAMVLHRDVIRIPSNVDYQTFILLCQVEGQSGAAYFDDLVLQVGVPSTWKEGLGQTDAGTALAGTIVVDASQRQRRIPSTLFGTNIEWVWDGNGIWDCGKDALNSSIVSMTRDSAPTLLRYPGGTFSDFYDWTKGIGPRSDRRAIATMPGGATSVPRFGTDEALEFARTSGGQLVITVNIVTGTPQMAADWVRYVNRSGLAVQYWEIGNESYVPGTPSSMNPEQYALTFVNFARAMREADPRIKLMAITDENFSYSVPRQYPDWTERMLRIAGPEIDCVSIHAGYAPAIGQDLGWPARSVYASMLGAPSAVAANLRHLSSKLATLVPGRDIRIAMTEWGPYFQTDLTGRFLDHPKTIGAALYTASMLKTMIESDRTDIANFFKLVDPFYLGAIGQRDSLYRANASHMAFGLVRKYVGENLVLSQTQSPVFDSPAAGWVDAAAAVPYLGSLASLSGDGTELFVLAINQHLDRSINVQIRLQRFTATGPAEVHSLRGLTPDSHTGSALPAITGVAWPKQAPVAPSTSFPTGSTSQIVLLDSTVAASASDVILTLPPGSVNAIVIPGKAQ